MEIKKKKILYGITKSNWGGAQRYVFDLATSLPKDTYEVSVLLGQEGVLEQKLQTAGIRTITLGNISRDIHLIKDLFVLIKIIKIFRREKPDIIHLNSSKMGLLGALAGRLTGLPKIIFTGHGWAFNEDRSKLQKKIIHLLHLLTIILSHRTIAVSEQTKNQITNNKYLLKKIITIQNGIDKIDFLDKNTARENILKKLSTNIDIKNRFWLGTISELHKNKGLKYMIEAIHLLDMKNDDKSTLPILIIIGDGEKKEKLQKRIDRYGLQETIFLVGQIDQASKYLKAFDVFTLTSITEALPYVILEAGLAGLPIIASAVGGIPEIITDMENGVLVRPKEPEEIQKAIDFLLEKPEKMTSFSEKIQTKILLNFSKEKMIKTTQALY
jgi:glycosyltransferase involved in cell wall biosynthesis